MPTETNSMGSLEPQEKLAPVEGKASELSKKDIAQRHLRLLQEILADISDKETIPRWEALHLFEPLLKALASA